MLEFWEKVRNKVIDMYAINEVTNGEYTKGTYEIDDEKKIVSYKLGAGAISVAVIEKFTALANHTGYTFQTKFNDKELSVSPGMTEEQVSKNFFGKNYVAPKKIDTYAIDEVANGKYTKGTYEIDDEKKVVSYKLGAGAVSVAVIEKFTALANHTGYTFQTKFNDRELSVSPGMTEEQVTEIWQRQQRENNLVMSQQIKTTLAMRNGDKTAPINSTKHNSNSPTPSGRSDNSGFGGGR